MPIEYRIAETVLRKIVVETDDPAEGLHAISELYSGRNTTPDVGSYAGFSFRIEDQHPVGIVSKGVDCPECKNGSLKVEGISAAFRCTGCAGAGMVLVDRDEKQEALEKKIADNLDVLYAPREDSSILGEL
jgi:hypothetical protein